MMSIFRFSAAAILAIVIGVVQPVQADIVTLEYELDGSISWAGSGVSFIVEAGDLPSGATLLEVGVDIAITSGGAGTWTEDFMFLFTAPGLSTPYHLQIGGFSTYGPPTLGKIDWENGAGGHGNLLD